MEHATSTAGGSYLQLYFLSILATVASRDAFFKMKQ